MNAREADVSFVELATALRRHAEGSPTSTAAVNLLISHQHWLQREPFLTRVEYLPADAAGPDYAVPDWQVLAATAERTALYDTDSEIAILRIACSIADGWLGDALTSCDEINTELIVEAVRYAGSLR